MGREDVVAAKLADLAHRVARVRANAVADLHTFAADENAIDIVSLNLMVAVQACADIASHLIADEGWPAASSIAESFQRLAAHGAISAATAAQLARAVGLRNVVAHGYERLDVARLHAAATTGVGDLETFAREIATWVRGQSQRP